MDQWNAWWLLTPNLERAHNWAEILGWICAIGIAIALVGMWWTGKIIRTRTQSQTVHLEEQVAEANRKAEEERLARIKIERRIAPRSLTAVQRASLLVALQRGPKAKVAVTSVGDGEAVAFANELVAIFQQAGWSINTIAGQMIGYNPEGLLIAVGDPSNPAPPAIAFDRALAAIGVNAAWTKEGGLPPDSFNLLVGHKPQQ